MLTGALPHIAPLRQAQPWDDIATDVADATGDDDGDEWAAVLPVGEPGTCWVCGRKYAYSVTDFDADGSHAACAITAWQMDRSFRAQGRQRAANAAPARPLRPHNIWTMQW